MKRFFWAVMVGAIFFLSACASSPIIKRGDTLSRGEGCRRPAVVVVDNQTEDDVHLIVDGRWTWKIFAGEIKSIQLGNLRECMIFTVKFPDGKSFYRALYIEPGRKYSISFRRGSNGEPIVGGKRRRTRTIGDKMMDVHHYHLDRLIEQQERRRRE